MCAGLQTDIDTMHGPKQSRDFYPAVLLSWLANRGLAYYETVGKVRYLLSDHVTMDCEGYEFILCSGYLFQTNSIVALLTVDCSLVREQTFTALTTNS